MECTSPRFIFLHLAPFLSSRYGIGPYLDGVLEVSRGPQIYVIAKRGPIQSEATSAIWMVDMPCAASWSEIGRPIRSSKSDVRAEALSTPRRDMRTMHDAAAKKLRISLRRTAALPCTFFFLPLFRKKVPRGVAT